MSATPMEQPGFCQDCDSPKGGYICRACADEQRGDVIGDARRLLIWKKTTAPGLTNEEVRLLEDFISHLEAVVGES